MNARRLRLYLVAAWVGLLIACSGPSSPNPPTPPGTGSATLPDTTKVLDASTLATLQSVNPAGRFTFNSSSPALQGLAVGDVFIAGVSKYTPQGALRKITSITPQGGGLVLETSPVRLQDAFESLDLHLDTTLKPSALAPQEKKNGLSFPLDLSASGDSGKVNLKGALSLDPSVGLTLDIDIASFSLKDLSLNFGASETFLATLTGQGQVSFDKSVTLGTVGFTPIIINVPYPGGLLPVVLTPQVVISAGLQGDAKGNFSGSVNQEADFTAGLGYEDGEFGGFSDSSSKFNFEQPVYDGALDAKALAGPKLEVLLYGAVGPYASAEGYVELSASAEGPPPCAKGVLNAGLTAKAGVDFLADYETTLFNKAYPLASFNSCGGTGARPAITWARSFGRVGSDGEDARAVIEVSDGTYLVVGDSTLFGDITGFGASLWAMRLDALGNIMWQKAYTRTTEGLARAVQEVPGGFVIATSLGLLKIDTGGNLLWAKTYDGGEYLEINSLAAQSDGSLIVAGVYGNTPQGWAMKVDANGSVLWSRRYGGDAFNRVRVTSDGGYILVGRISSNFNDAYLVKLDADGNVSWQRALDNRYDESGGKAENPTIEGGTDAGLDVAEKPGGDYVVVGTTYGDFPNPEPSPVGHFEAWVAEVGADGSIQGSTVYRAPADADADMANYDIAQAVAVRPNGSAVVFGRRADVASDLFDHEDILIIQGGAFSVLGGSGNDTLNAELGEIGNAALALTQDGGLILAATSNSFAGQEQFWLVKMGRTANVNFPYLTNLAGASYDTEHAVSLEASASVTDAPLTATDAGDIGVESTPVTSTQQAP